MNIFKKILRRLYHLIAFLGLFVLFITDVNADVSTFSFSNIKYYDNNGLKNSTSYVSSTTNTRYYGLNMTSSKFTITFDNNFSNYDEIGFQIYDSYSEISSNYNYNPPIMPLVILDGYPCSVTPIGISSADSPYNYNGDEFVLCPVKQKTGSHYVDIFTYKNTNFSSLFVGVHVNYVNGYTDDATLSDVVEQQQQIDDTLNNNDVTGANSQVDDLLNDSNFNDSTGIQSIINAPLNFINSLSTSCSPINLTIPYIDKSVQIPCIKQELNNHIPLVIPVLSTAINGFIIYRILLDIVRMIKNARNPDDDRIEVLEL